jgi:hypothetical protein
VVRKTAWCAAFALVALVALLGSAWADSLELRNGSLIKGRYLGGSDSEIRFQVGSSVQRFAVVDVQTLRFDSDTAASAAPPPAPPQRSDDPPALAPRPAADDAPPPPPTNNATAASAGTVNLPSGTRLTVRTIDAVDSDRNQVGDRFKASLEQAIVVDGTTLVPKGADVYGRLSQATEAGHIQGRSQLKLELTGIVVRGQTYPLVTGEYSVAGSSRGASSARRIGGATAAGTIIGAIAGGGRGAAIGAGVGAGAGTAVQVVTRGEQVHVPSETLLEFTLQQDVRLPAAGGYDSGR